MNGIPIIVWIVGIFVLSSSIINLLLSGLWVRTRQRQLAELEGNMMNGTLGVFRDGLVDITNRFEAAQSALDVATRSTKTFSFLGGCVSSIVFYYFYS